jgi:hypothetical protein
MMETIIPHAIIVDVIVGIEFSEPGYTFEYLYYVSR